MNTCRHNCIPIGARRGWIGPKYTYWVCLHCDDKFPDDQTRSCWDGRDWITRAEYDARFPDGHEVDVEWNMSIAWEVGTCKEVYVISEEP